MGRQKGSLDSQQRKRRSASTEQLSAKAGKKKKDGLTALSASDTGAQAFRAHFKAAGGPVAGGRTCG
jgi:hypothetical protein